MSASDRLGALLSAIARNDDGAALAGLLPQIVAVIEAAQGCTDWHRPEGNFTRLSAALDELDRALS